MGIIGWEKAGRPEPTQEESGAVWMIHSLEIILPLIIRENKIRPTMIQYFPMSQSYFVLGVGLKFLSFMAWSCAVLNGRHGALLFYSPLYLMNITVNQSPFL